VLCFNAHHYMNVRGGAQAPVLFTDVYANLLSGLCVLVAAAGNVSKGTAEKTNF